MGSNHRDVWLGPVTYLSVLYNYAEPLKKFIIRYDTCILQRQLVRETVCLVFDGVKNQIETGECTSENNYKMIFGGIM